MTEQETRAMDLAKSILNVFHEHAATHPEKAAAMQIVAALSLLDMHDGCEACEEQDDFPDPEPNLTGNWN